MRCDGQFSLASHFRALPHFERAAAGRPTSPFLQGNLTPDCSGAPTSSYNSPQASLSAADEITLANFWNFSAMSSCSLCCDDPNLDDIMFWRNRVPQTGYREDSCVSPKNESGLSLSSLHTLQNAAKRAGAKMRQAAKSVRAAENRSKPNRCYRLLTFAPVCRPAKLCEIASRKVTAREHLVVSRVST